MAEEAKVLPQGLGPWLVNFYFPDGDGWLRSQAVRLPVTAEEAGRIIAAANPGAVVGEIEPLTPR